MGELIDPVRQHVYGDGSTSKVIHRACIVFQTGRWRQRWRKAQAEDDFSTLDRLDREFEMIGLP